MTNEIIAGFETLMKTSHLLADAAQEASKLSDVMRLVAEPGENLRKAIAATEELIRASQEARVAITAVMMEQRS
jgi:Flp pilus assembly protein TadB